MKDDLVCLNCTLPFCNEKSKDCLFRIPTRATNAKAVRIYRLRHPDRVKDAQKRYRANNPETIAEIQRNWVDANRERKNELNRQWRKKQKEKVI